MRHLTRGLVAISCAVLVACTGEASTPSAPQVAGGTLRVGVIDTGICRLTLCGGAWDPQLSYFNIQYELGRCCLLRSLLSFNGRPVGEGGGVLRPDVAESLPEITPDGLTWTFHLRQGLHYAPPLQDAPIVAQDFVRSIERALGPTPPELDRRGWGNIMDSFLGGYLNLQNLIQGARAYATGHATRITGLETPDDHTLVVRLDEPSGTLGSLLAEPDLAPIPPNPANPSARFGVADGYPYGPSLVASGPYMVEGAADVDLSVPPGDRVRASGDTAGSLTLIRNPSWSRDDDPLRLASADRIVLVRVASPKEGRDLISKGRLDVLWDWDSTPEGVAAARDLPGVRLESVSRDTMRFLRMSMAAQPFDDVHVRRAVAYAVDRIAATDTMTRAGVEAEPAFHDGLDSQEENLLANFDPFDAADGPSLDLARQEMARSRYDHDHDGRCDDPACRGFLFPVLTPFDAVSRGRLRVADGVARDIAPLGLVPKVYAVESQDLIYDRPEAHVAMSVDGWLKDGTTASSWFGALFGSADIGTIGAPGNYFLLGVTPKQLKDWGYRARSVPNVDEQIRTCMGLVFQAQTQCWAELDRYITEEIVPMVPLLVQVQTTLVSDRVSTYRVDVSAGVPVAALDQLVVPPGPVDVPVPQPAGPLPDIPAGTYGMTVTRHDLLAAFPEAGKEDIGYNAGPQTLVLDGQGGWYLILRNPRPDSPYVAAGTYSSEGSSSVVFRVEANQYQRFDGSLLRWRMVGDDLRLTMQDCRTDDPVFCAFLGVGWTAHDWQRVS